VLSITFAHRTIHCDDLPAVDAACNPGGAEYGWDGGSKSEQTSGLEIIIFKTVVNPGVRAMLPLTCASSD
jgi:hypothetical protein